MVSLEQQRFEWRRADKSSNLIDFPSSCVFVNSNSFFSQWGGAPAQEAHWTLGNQVIVFPRQLRENFLVPHSSPGSLGEMKRPSGFSIGGTWWQWRSRGRRKQELEDPEIVFPMIVTFVCFKVKVGAIWSPLSLFSLTFIQSKMFQSLMKHHWRWSDSSESCGYSVVLQ